MSLTPVTACASADFLWRGVPGAGEHIYIYIYIYTHSLLYMQLHVYISATYLEVTQAEMRWNFHPANQSPVEGAVVYLIVYRVLAPSQVVQHFFHQLYVKILGTPKNPWNSTWVTFQVYFRRKKVGHWESGSPPRKISVNYFDLTLSSTNLDTFHHLFSMWVVDQNERISIS